MSSVVIEALITGIFREVGRCLTSGAGKAIHGKMNESISNIRNHTELHLKYAYEKCSRIKTIIGSDKPIDVLDVYVNTHFTHNNEEVDDYSVIEEIPQNKKIVISGTAGSGKSMFMRYLLMSFFENPHGKIPIFIELRSLNNLSKLDFFQFIYRTIAGSDKNISPNEMRELLKLGTFVFIFDGFDEIDHDIRSDAERQILECCSDYGNNNFVISGRPEDRFESWPEFYQYKVRPMTKNQVIDLLNKIDYDVDVKKKFIDRLKKELYQSHKSFMSNPLLVSMMLLTFHQYANIPDKMHVFYDQAFDTLYSRHDAIKQSFQRKLRTNITITDFKHIFSIFCSMTYINEKFQFTESEIHEYLDKSKKYSGIDFVVSDFVSDLFDGVCVVQREGVEISFTHRSFQEYFTAYFVSRNTEVDLDLFFEKIADRWNDSVILMLFDMNQGFVERNWGANALAEIGSAVKGILPSVDAIGYCKALNIEILITSVDGAIRLIISDSDSRVTRLRRILSRIYSDELRPAKGELASLQRKDHQAFLNGFNKDKIRFNSSFKLKVHKKKVAKIHSDLDYVEIGNVHARLGSEDATWLETSGLAVFLQREYDGFMKLESKVQKRVSRKDDLILDIMSRT